MSESLTALIVFIIAGVVEAPVLLPSEAVLVALREAVRRRTAMNAMFKVWK